MIATAESRPAKHLIDRATADLYRERLRRPIAKKVLQARWALAERDPMYFLQHFVYTLDQHDPVNPIKPFPWQRPYIRELVKLWLDCRLITVLKARQMVMTWLFVALSAWDGACHDGRLIMLQSKREEDAIGDANAGDGLLGRAQFILNFMPGRSLLLPGYEPLGKKVIFRDNASTLWAIPQGGPIIRQRTASGILSDEAAFQPEFGDAYASARPCIRGGGWFVALTTADLSDGGAFRALHEDTLDAT